MSRESKRKNGESWREVRVARWSVGRSNLRGVLSLLRSLYPFPPFRARALSPSPSFSFSVSLSPSLSLPLSLARSFVLCPITLPPYFPSLSIPSAPLVRLSLSLSLALSLSVSLRVSRVFQWVHEAHQEQSGKVAMEADETAQVSAERGSPPLGTTLRMPATGLRRTHPAQLLYRHSTLPHRRARL